MNFAIRPDRLARHCFEIAKPGSKLLGLDVSRSAVGVALSTPDMSQAIPLQVIPQGKFQNKRSELYKTTSTVYSVLQIVAERAPVAGIVVGWPLDLGNHMGESCLYVEHFVEVLHGKLAEIGSPVLPIALWDEFETTKRAREKLSKSPSLFYSSKLIDDHAAAFMLQDYLDKFFSPAK